MMDKQSDGEHIVKSYDEELKHLNETIVEMGSKAEVQIQRAIESLINRNAALAERVIEDDDEIDDLNLEVDIQATRLLALRQPIAADLRTVVTALKISSDLERIADYASNIARRAIDMKESSSSRWIYAIRRMARFAQDMIEDVLAAYVERDVDKALRVWESDTELDEMYNSLFRELLTYLIEDPRDIIANTHTLFIAKHIERIGDHVTNIAETIFFLVNGTRMRQQRLKGIEQASVVASRITGGVSVMSAVILIVDDDEAITTLVRYNLENEGFHILEARDGEEALRLVDERPVDLVLLDWMIPYVSGIEFCRRMRGRPDTRKLPIIMLTARADTSDRITALNVGADDFISKPFPIPELIARIRAVLRRSQGSADTDHLVVGTLEMNLATHRVFLEGRHIHLGPTEFRLLRFLMENPERVFSRDQLIDRVWGHNIHVEARTVDVHIRRLRKALGAGNKSNIIRTVRAVGYALEKPKSMANCEIGA